MFRVIFRLAWRFGGNRYREFYLDHIQQHFLQTPTGK